MTSSVYGKPAEKVRMPVVAGTFYPAGKEELKNMVDSFLDVKFSKKTEGRLIGLIAPHAGYIYSGKVAGYAYAPIKDKPYRTVIVIGPSHAVAFDGAALDTHDEWNTPLGSVPLNKTIASALQKQDTVFNVYPDAFAREHSLEVQIPFLQRTLKDFTIVPIVIGAYTPDTCKRIADALYAVTKDKKDVLIIISSDLSHYYPYATAEKLDNALLEDVIQGKGDIFLSGIEHEKYEACGAGGIGVLLYLMERYGGHIEEITYANSGDTAGDKSQVVGYAALAAYTDEKSDPEKSSVQESEQMLSASEQKEALKIARETIDAYLLNRTRKTFKPKGEVFYKPCGAFVTLHERGALRGCIGNIVGYKPLWETIRDMAIASATEDPRFNPVTHADMKNISIEISVLSPLKKATADEIVLGKHGVIVKKGMYQGVFLPQVADETGWTKEEFLGHLCQDKAGLSWDAWKSDDVELFTFTAQVFGEK